jgi:SAM-dependent methyltransferase
MAGLSQNRVFEYWKERAGKQGKKTVGYSGKNLLTQKWNYNKRFKFIISKINTDAVTLDYGCGVGRYSSFFDKNKYQGADITAELLDIARKDNPDYSYTLLDTPNLSNVDLENIEQFFCATVLQHNDDDGVKKILESLCEKVGDKELTIVLYENVQTVGTKEKEKIKFRDPIDYFILVNLFFDVKNVRCYKHIIHKEEHALMIFESCKNRNPKG